MNNSLVIENIGLTLDEVIDVTPGLRQRETELIKIIEALEHVASSNYWKVLETSIFNKELQSLISKLESEKNPTEIYRLQGQIARAKKLDLNKEIQAYRQELGNIRKNLNDNS